MPDERAPRPRRVLHVFGAMNRGGSEIRTLQVMHETDRDRFQLEFCALSGRAGVLDDEIRALGGEVHPVPLRLGLPFAFTRLLKARRIDVVHSHVHYFSGAVLALAAAAGVPRRIAHFRATQDEHAPTVTRAAYHVAMRALIRSVATGIIGCAVSVLEEAWRHDWRADPRCAVIHNGVDVDAYAPFDDPVVARAVLAECSVPDGAPLLVQVGRFHPVKQQRRLPALLATIPGAHLLCVGRLDDDEAPATRDAVARLQLTERVHFLGERTDVPRLLSAADLLLLTSTAEGLPGALLEAAAAGTPFLSSALPGAREILDVLPGAGALVDLRETDGAWGSAAQRLLARTPLPGHRAAARAAVAGSIFSIAHATRLHEALWEARSA